MRKSVRGLAIGTAVLVTMLGIGLSVASSALAQAAPRLTLDAALRLSASLFSIPSYYTLTQESYDSSADQGEPSYSLSYSYTTPDNQSRYMDVTIGANTGTVLNYDASSTATGFVYPVPVSLEKARSLALAWAKKLYPKQLPSVQIQAQTPETGPLTQPITYQFNFSRTEQGIPAPFDGFSLTLDQNGKLVGATDHWSGWVFPSRAAALSMTQAESVYRDSLHLYLAYQTIWKGDATPVPYLTYQMPSTADSSWWNEPFGEGGIGEPVIDGISGRLIDATGSVVKAAVYQPPQPIVPGGPTEYPGQHKVNWSETQAQHFAQSLLQISSQAILTAASQTQSLPSGDVLWSFSWKTGAKGSSTDVTVDATLGMLTNYDAYPQSSPTTPGNSGKTITQTQVDAAAAAFVKRLFPKDTGGLAIVTSDWRPPIFATGAPLQSFLEVASIIHGVPMLDNGSSIQVDPNTGRVIAYYGGNFLKSESRLPMPAQAIGTNKAESVWMHDQPLVLQYLMTQSSANLLPRVVLVYAPASTLGQYGMLFDAVTGQFISQDVSPQPYAGVLRDVAGNPAAAEIQILVSHGLLSVDAKGDVYPERDMTRAEFVKLVVDAFGYQHGGPVPLLARQSMADVGSGSPAYNAIATAFQRGWLQAGKLFKPNDPITRGDAAQLLARALGYASLLEHPDIFYLPAKDRTEINKNQLGGDAIAYALGMLALQNGRVNPNGHVTVADAAVAVVHMVSSYSEGQQIFTSGLLASAGGGVRN